MMVRFGVCGQFGLHGLAIELAVDLGCAGRARRRPWSGSAGGTGCRSASASRPMTPSRASISRTRWPLPRPPMAGLQRHLADGLELVGQQQGARADARGRGRGLAAGVAAADDDDVPDCVSGDWVTGGDSELGAGPIASDGRPVILREGRRRRAMFHVKQPYLPMQKVEKTSPSTSSTPTAPAIRPGRRRPGAHPRPPARGRWPWRRGPPPDDPAPAPAGGGGARG